MDQNTPAFDHHIRTLSTRQIGGWQDRATRWLRLGLPVATLALLALIVIWPFLNSRQASFILSKQGIENNTDVLRMERPMYRGRDSRGRAFVISAQQAAQKSNTNPLVELTGINALLTLSQGQAELKAERGIFDMKREQLHIAGKISVERADGYTFQTLDAVLDLPSRIATGTQGVSGQTPIGTFYAKSFQVNVETGLVAFTGGVKMRITPKR